MSTKTIASLTAILLFGLSVTCAASTGSERDERRTLSEVDSCVAEIAKRVDYGNAARVVHRVTELRQKNLLEVEMKIDVSVYDEALGVPAREYLASCVVAQLGKVVEVKVEPSADTPATAD